MRQAMAQFEILLRCSGPATAGAERRIFEFSKRRLSAEQPLRANGPSALLL